MPRPSASTVKTPGVVDAPKSEDAENGETDMDELAKGAPDLDGGHTTPAPAPTQGTAAPGADQVTMSLADLQSLIAGEVAKAVAAQRPASGEVAPPAKLPDQSEIDRSKIVRPTLSAQGYVVPIGYGEPADPSIKRI